MKACVIFGFVLCAFIAQTRANIHEFQQVRQRLALAVKKTTEIEQVLFDSSNLSLEKLRGLLESLVNILLPIAEELLEQADVLLRETLTKAKDILANAEPVLKKVIDDVIRVLEVIAEEHPVAIERRIPAIEALARDSAVKLKVCWNNAVEEGKQIKGEIQDEINAIKASLSALKNILAQCKHDDPAEVAKCVVSKAKEIQQGLAQLLDDVKKVIEATAPKVGSIVKQTIACVEPIVENAKVEGKNIVEKVKACVDGKETDEQTFEVATIDNRSLEKLRELLEKFVTVAVPILEELLQQADVILKEALEKTKEIVDKAEPVLQEVIDEVIRVLEILAAEHPVAVKCVEEQRPAIKALVGDSPAKLKVCGENAVEEGIKAKSEIQGEIDAVKVSLVALKNLLAESKNKDPAEAARCIIKKSKEVREKILELADKAKQVIETAAPKVTVIVDNTLECIKPVLVNAKSQGAKIMKDVKQCIANGY